MKFDIVDFNNRKKWHDIVKTTEIYYQWEYIDAFEKNGDGIPKLAFAKHNDEIVFDIFFLRSINADIKINTKNMFFDIITPYGYGGVYCNSSNKELLNFYFSEFANYCLYNNIISEFVRLNPMNDNYMLYPDDYDIKKISKIVYIDLIDENQIWNNMESRCRNTIRKAQQKNIIIKSGFNKKMLDEFKDIYNETMNRNNAEDYYFFNDLFYDSMINSLKRYALIYTAYVEDKAVSSSIIIYNGENAYYHLSGTLSDYLYSGVSSYLLYNISIDLLNKGLKRFYLGGGYGGDKSSLFKFKKQFSKYGKLDFYVGKKIYNEKVYNELCELKKISTNLEFFPAYRAKK